MRYSILTLLGALFIMPVANAGHGKQPPSHGNNGAITLSELHGPARILRDVDGMPHIYAMDEHDALFLQGWVQAQDRLFQLDVLRRQASGTLAELVGTGALASDIELRTIGLKRGAERSLAAYSPATRAGLQAYADGVNAWVKRNPLPLQYTALEITKFQPWTALDCAVIGKALAFQLSFDLDTGATSDYQTYAARLGPRWRKRCSSATSSAQHPLTKHQPFRMRPARRRSWAGSPRAVPRPRSSRRLPRHRRRLRQPA